jgi:dTDP-4-dehydrorhamnose 3,5-epimerase
MEVQDLEIEGLKLISLKQIHDDRGYFFESFNEKRFKEMTGVDVDFVQDNVSLSYDTVIRGLHYQEPPMAQGKYVQVLKGKVMDVAVDIRPNSPTFLKSVSVELSGTNGMAFYIPPGFAHGFKVTDSAEAVFMYKVTNYYSPEHERAIHYADPDLGVKWGGTRFSTISQKDDEAPFLNKVLEDLRKLSW